MKYEEPKMELVLLLNSDVVTASACTQDEGDFDLEGMLIGIPSC